MGDVETKLLKGQAEIWKYMFSFADSMALKSAVELRIADIIHSHGHPLTLSQIAHDIGSPSPDITCLARVMRMLVRKKIFTASDTSDGTATVYGLTDSAMWILHDAELSLAPMLLMQNHTWLMAPWHCLRDCVRDGGIAFEKAHGRQIWDFASSNPEFNKIFNDAMQCTAKITMRAIMSTYKDGFSTVGSVVDVGGGTGMAVTELVRAHPHIVGINFDLPHVVATAPEIPGVTHVGGDMFEAVPSADAVFMKWIMHDWNDEDCVQILKNCKKAVPEKTGKVIIVDIVLKPDGDGLFDESRLTFDLLMIAHTTGGKERSEPEWKALLERAGFPRYNIIEIPSLPSIIEAFPIP